MSVQSENEFETDATIIVGNEKNDHNVDRVIAPVDDHQNTEATHVFIQLEEIDSVHNEDHDCQDDVSKPQMVKDSNDEQPHRCPIMQKDIQLIKKACEVGMMLVRVIRCFSHLIYLKIKEKNNQSARKAGNVLTKKN
jgi:hypothetical protein